MGVDTVRGGGPILVRCDADRVRSEERNDPDGEVARTVVAILEKHGNSRNDKDGAACPHPFAQEG
jgi:hypothetical protein